MKIGMIGKGAIASYVCEKLAVEGHDVTAFLLRAERVRALQDTAPAGVAYVSRVADLPRDLDLVVDCAGHGALQAYGADVLRSGRDLVSLSLGALADPALEASLRQAARAGDSALVLASGAIGGLDALRSARTGGLSTVRYVGRKPPAGWKGSPAEAKVDLDALTTEAFVHFEGSAREAAQAYPKNANVAAAVALAGVGFDRTQAMLIADPTVTENIHEVIAEGAFGQFSFRIAGNALPGNPRSSALAAMSVVDTILERSRPIRF